MTGPATVRRLPAWQAGALPWLMPALVLIVLLALIPQLWLASQSISTQPGSPWAHYERLMTQSYLLTLWTTVRLSLIVCVLTVVLGYPVAYALAVSESRWRYVLLAAILVPFWTPLLVRTYAWLVLLQRSGPLAELSRALDLPVAREGLAYSFQGTVIGMVHIMLPFFILPLAAVLRAISPRLRDAAISLGASPAQAFRTVYLPLSLPGVFAGATLVFVLSIGFYITPAVLGGGRVLVWATRIATAVQQHGDWGVASALAVVLLASTFTLLGAAWCAQRFWLGRYRA